MYVMSLYVDLTITIILLENKYVDVVIWKSTKFFLKQFILV